MYFDARAGAKLGLLQLFLGTTYPGALFKPQLSTNYSDPLLWAHSDRGDISILGFSGSPLAPLTTGHLFVDVATALGSVKVEINGGGFNGNYTAKSARGKTIVEVDGSSAPLSGKAALTLLLSDTFTMTCTCV